MRVASGRVRLAHLFSSELGISTTLPFVEPLRERGWEITFLTPDGPTVRLAEERGYRWLPHRFTRHMDPVGDASAAIGLMKTLVAERFDVVHTHNVKVSLVGRLLAALARTPAVVHTLHGLAWSLETPQPSRAIHATMERVASLGADLILAQSREDLAACLNMRVAPPEKFRLIGNGINLDRYDPSRIPPDARARTRQELGVSHHQTLVLFPGRVVKEKGMEEVFIAAGQLANDDVRVAVAGRDDSERADAPSPESFRVARSSGVMFLGERSDMPELYAACDVVGLASWREGMPRALMEGASMQRALLATDVRGCREVVRDGVTGILVPAKNPAGLADGIRRLAHDQALRERLALAARMDALERFDLRTSVGHVIAAYEHLIAQRAPHRGRVARFDTDTTEQTERS